MAHSFNHLADIIRELHRGVILAFSESLLNRRNVKQRLLARYHTWQFERFHKNVRTRRLPELGKKVLALFDASIQGSRRSLLSLALTRLYVPQILSVHRLSLSLRNALLNGLHFAAIVVTLIKYLMFLSSTLHRFAVL